jgi:hypothetical protein
VIRGGGVSISEIRPIPGGAQSSKKKNTSSIASARK